MRRRRRHLHRVAQLAADGHLLIEVRRLRLLRGDAVLHLQLIRARGGAEALVRVLVDGSHVPRALHKQLHLLDRQRESLRELLIGRVAPELGDELLLHLGDAHHHVVDVHRHADDTRLLRDGTGYGLFNPPRGVGGKPEAWVRTRCEERRWTGERVRHLYRGHICLQP